MVIGHHNLLALSLLLIMMMISSMAGQSVSQDVSGEQGEVVAIAYREAFAAFRKRDFVAATDSFRRAYDINPKDDMTVYFIAGTYALAGNQSSALEWLGKLADLNAK